MTLVCLLKLLLLHLMILSDLRPLFIIEYMRRSISPVVIHLSHAATGQVIVILHNYCGSIIIKHVIMIPVVVVVIEDHVAIIRVSISLLLGCTLLPLALRALL